MERRVKPAREEPSRDAPEVVAAIAERLRSGYSYVATVDLTHTPNYLADLVVTPLAVGAVGMSLVGMGGEFVFTIRDKTHRRWEIENNVSGRAELEVLISDVVEGRMAFSRWPFRPQSSYLPYR